MSGAIEQMNRLTRAIEQGYSSIYASNVNEVLRILDVPNAREIVNMCDAELYTALFHTARIPNQDLALQITNILIEKGANPYHKEENKQTVLYYLAKEGRAKIIERLLTCFKYDLNDPDKYHQNPLYWAASHGRLKVAELLIRHGVNINHLDQNAQTCLFYAAREGQLEMCKFLVNQGCKFDLVDKNKKTPLHFAKTYKHHALVEYFNNLKQFSKSKPSKDSKHHESKQQKETMPKPKEKKKEVQRSEYVLVYTNEEGMTHQVKDIELEQFMQNARHRNLMDYCLHPEKLDEVDLKNDKKAYFYRTALKLLTGYFKRADLQLFYEPVDTSKYTDYLNHVQKPMDFSTIRQKLNFNCYQNEQQFRDDVVLIYQNCIKYNGSESIFGQMAKMNKMEFLDTYKRQFTL